MKGKRIICAVLAALMMLACFALTANADAIKDANEKCTISITLKTADNVPVKGAKFTITGGDLTDPLVITTNENGLADTNNTSGEATLAQGTYHVEQKSTDLGVMQAAAAEAFDVTLPYTDPTSLDTWLYSVSVSPKVNIISTTPSVAKKVADTDTDTAYGQSASIMSYADDYAFWKVTVSLCDGINSYKTLKITDRIDERLSDFELIRVVNNADGAQLSETTDFTQTYSNREFKLAFTKSCIENKLADNTTVDIFFKTKIDLSKDDTIGEKIGNHVVLSFTNALDSDGVKDNTPGTDGDEYDPDTDTTGTTPPPTWPTNPGDDPDSTDPYVWTGALTFTKIEKGDASKKLDAEFKLYNADTNEQIGATVTGENGVYTIKGLKGGISQRYNYYLVETKAPSGYSLIGTKLSFYIQGIDTAVVRFGTTSAASVNEATETYFSFEEAADVFTNYIVNIPSPALPVTGGIGVWAFALIGAALALAGAAFAVKSKKTEA